MDSWNFLPRPSPFNFNVWILFSFQLFWVFCLFLTQLRNISWRNWRRHQSARTWPGWVALRNKLRTEIRLLKFVLISQFIENCTREKTGNHFNKKIVKPGLVKFPIILILGNYFFYQKITMKGKRNSYKDLIVVITCWVVGVSCFLRLSV